MLHEIIFFVIIVIVCVSNSYGYKHLPTISLSKRISSTKSISSLAAFTATEATYTLGAPSSKPNNGQFVTTGELVVSYNVEEVVDYQSRIDKLRDDLDNNKGILLKSSYEYPGRYSRWTVGFTAPAVQIEGTGLDFSITPLNERGEVILKMLAPRIESEKATFEFIKIGADHSIVGKITNSTYYFAEEERSKQPSLFSLIRIITSIMSSPDSGQFGLYGAFGYDLAYQFEKIELKKARNSEQRDLVLYLPDEILIVDNQKGDAWCIKYELEDPKAKLSTRGIPRANSLSPFERASDENWMQRDLPKGTYAKQVVQAKNEFRVGNLFEVVISQTFREKLGPKTLPSQIFSRLSTRNPSPYGFFMNLGKNEFLVGASPEMFVRVEHTKKGLRVETCPISGTIERGSDALEDAQQIKKLLINSKEESELTMCTDVDRNDKSRICIPGSVKVLGRRQIEMYSRLIHTVDHVEGYLRKEFDALDAFLCHTWAVTVTGAPKTWAMRFLEDVEKVPRSWYGGAVGMIGFDGTLNTGLTLRTVRILDGIAEVRAGATLLHDSDPDAEEAETELKASAMLDAIMREDGIDSTDIVDAEHTAPLVDAKKVLLVDHEDSFVHTLANYIRQTGVEVVTCRSGEPLKLFLEEHDKSSDKIDLVLLSPGPGNPSDFKLKDTISAMIERKIPIFGVCLGLQGLVEYYGGTLDILSYPMHGKPSIIKRVGEHTADDILNGLPDEFGVARYHSLYGRNDNFPQDLKVTAVTSDGVVMAVQHRTLPIAAVQFHPESILTLPKHGMKIIRNVLQNLKKEGYP